MAKLIFECEIPGRVGIKKNRQQIVRPRRRSIVVPSSRYRAWARTALAHVSNAKVLNSKAFSGRCTADYVFHFKNRSGEPDVSNCIEGPQDLLQTAGVIKNDKQIISFSARKVFDGTEKTTIQLFEADEQEQ